MASLDPQRTSVQLVVNAGPLVVLSMWSWEEVSAASAFSVLLTGFQHFLKTLKVWGVCGRNPEDIVRWGQDLREM